MQNNSLWNIIKYCKKSEFNLLGRPCIDWGLWTLTCFPLTFNKYDFLLLSDIFYFSGGGFIPVKQVACCILDITWLLLFCSHIKEAFSQAEVLCLQDMDHLKILSTSWYNSTGETSTEIINRNKTSEGKKGQDHKHPTVNLVSIYLNTSDWQMWVIVWVFWLDFSCSTPLTFVVYGEWKL